MNVVTSFFEHNKHPGLNPLVPSIMICVPKAQISFYNCTKDLLLLSHTFQWLNLEDGKREIDKAVILLLWITGYHRYVLWQCICLWYLFIVPLYRIFLNVFPNIEETHQSTVESNLKVMNAFDHFKNLRDIEHSWKVRSVEKT